MAVSKVFTDKINNAGFENNQNLTPAELLIQEQFNAAGGLGNYQKTNVEDIVNNFMATHVGTDKVIKKVPRHEAEFWAQRAVQEFSYDLLYSENNIEFEIGERIEFPLPADYVNYVKITHTNRSGVERTLHPARTSTGKQAILQDADFNSLYDDNGEFLTAQKSETIKRFQEPGAGTLQGASDLYFSNDDEYNFGYFDNLYFGRRYGNDPQFENSNGAFVIDTYKGMIYLDSSFARTIAAGADGEIISLRYVSDGLADNGDLSKVYVHKFAEDAVYAYLLYNLTKVRPSTVSLASLYKKEAFAKMRNAKIRLSQYKTEEITQVLRGVAKWIKH